MKKKFLILCLFVFSCFFVFFSSYSSKAELIDTYSYTNAITSRGYYFTSNTITPSDYESHTNAFSSAEYTLNYTLNFTGDDVTFKLNSVYISGSNYTTVTKYYNVWLSNVKQYSSNQMLINGQPDLKLSKFNNTSHYDRTIKWLFYIPSGSYYYVFEIVLVVNPDFLIPDVLRSETFTDQYNSYNRLYFDLGATSDSNYFVSLSFSKPIGDSYAFPTYNIVLDSSKELLNYKNGVINDVKSNPNLYGLYSYDELIQEQSTYYNRGYDAGVVVGQTAQPYSFNKLISAVFDVPVTTLVSLLDFNILGHNLKPLVITLLSLSIIMGVIRFVALKNRGD